MKRVQDEYPFKSRFTSIVASSVPEDVDTFLSKASLASLKKLIPDNINYEDNIDLIANAFNACVVNRVNKNDDGITTATALQIYKNFIHKPCNIEHKRNMVVGAITSAGFSSFGDNELLDIEGLENNNDPFNLALSAIVYRIVNEDFANLLVESSDPTSDKYQFVCASWELAFKDFHILVGSKNMNEGELITDPEKIKELSKFLKAKGGTGVTDKNEAVYRIPTGEVLPLGIGYTSNPAADVKGVFVDLFNDDKEDEETEARESVTIQTSDETDKNTDEEKTEETPENDKDLDKSKEKEEISNTNEQKISHSTKTNVKNGEAKIMKITSLKDITDKWEELRSEESSAKTVTSFIQEELEKASEQWSAKVEKEKTEAATATQKAEEAIAELARLKEEFKKTSEELQDLQAAQAAKEAEETFNSRMSALDSEYELGDEERQVIIAQIEGLNDEAFTSWKKSFDVLAKEKSKAHKAALASQDESKANKDGKEKNTDKAVEEAFANAKKPEETVPNAATENLGDKNKWKKACDPENVEITR